MQVNQHFSLADTHIVHENPFNFKCLVMLASMALLYLVLLIIDCNFVPNFIGKVAIWDIPNANVIVQPDRNNPDDEKQLATRPVSPRADSVV